MKILHAILSTGFYGSERYCAELMAAQMRAGHDVRMVTVAPNPDVLESFRQTLAVARPPQAGGDCDAEPFFALPRWPVLQRPFAGRILRGFAPALVHTHLDPAVRRVGYAARKLAIPHVATLHVDYNHREYSQCDGIICISEWQRASIPPSHPGEIALISNWLPDPIANALARTRTEDVEGLRQSWGAGPSTFVFGSVGRLMSEKGMDLLVRAFRRAFPAGAEDTRLILVGDGERRDEIEQLAAGDARIVLAGWQGDLGAYYLGFDTFVSAARFEPFGLVILEAMAAGCPLVLTRSRGPQDFVRDPRVLWADPDAAALAECLDRAARAGRRRLRYDMQPFSAAAAFAAIEALYRRIIERRVELTAQIRSPTTVTRTP
jgi:glycosyltransferase involved in cell wall biosynthesis